MREFFEDVVKLQMEPELNPREKALRDEFVREFYFDRNPTAAARRLGFVEGFAEDYAKRFMCEPYVRNKMKEYELNLLKDEPNQLDEKRRMVEQKLLAEANYHGPGSSHSARVAALNKLCALYGMDKPAKDEDVPEDVNYGGVMVVPALTSPDEWEQAASSLQSSLKASVKT